MSDRPKSGSRAPLFIGGAVVVVLVLVTLWSRRAPTVPEAVPAESAAADVVPEDAASRRMRPSAAARPPMSPADNTARERVRAEHAASVDKARADAVAAYDGETIDAAWAPGKERELAKISALENIEAAQAVKPTRLDVDCRSSMCRVEGAFKDSGAAQDWLLMYTSSLGDAMPRAVVSQAVNPDGTVSVQMYGKAR